MIIDSYRFLEPLGRGSFGEVWRVEICKAERLMGQRFAAKISYLPADHEDTTREMQDSLPIITAKHPHILQLLSGESFHGGRLLLLMELADGSLLDHWRQCRASEEAIPLGALVRYLRQAAVALDYIHGNGLVHGGINPGDILLHNGHAKIADPGPSIDSDHSLKRIQLTNLSKAICMAPERKHGTNSVQSDQYALAATYAWLRAGQPIVGLENQPDSVRSIGCFTSREQQALLKALSPVPEHRYPTCVEFTDALQQE